MTTRQALARRSQHNAKRPASGRSAKRLTAGYVDASKPQPSTTRQRFCMIPEQRIGWPSSWISSVLNGPSVAYLKALVVALPTEQ